MIEEYWKVEVVKDGYKICDDLKNEVIAIGSTFEVTTRGLGRIWLYRVDADATAHYANHLGIRPPAPVVSLPNLFGLLLSVQGDTVTVSNGTTHTKDSTVKQLRAMLAVLDPEPVSDKDAEIERLKVALEEIATAADNAVQHGFVDIGEMA